MSRMSQTSRYWYPRGTGKKYTSLTDILSYLHRLHDQSLRLHRRIDGSSSTPVTATFDMEEEIGLQKSRALSALQASKTWPHIEPEPREKNMYYAIAASFWLTIFRHAASRC